MCDSRKSAYSSKYCAVAGWPCARAKPAAQIKAAICVANVEGGVAAVFLPAFLGRDRPMTDEIAGGFQHHRIRIKILKTLHLVKLPGKEDGQGDLIQLDAVPVGFAVDLKFWLKPPSSFCVQAK